MQSRDDQAEVDGPTPRLEVGRGVLLRLTAGKWIANVALRWIPFFLFVLEDAFDAETTTLTLILGVGEMMGLATLLLGPALDRGRERAVMVAGMVLISGSGIIALAGTTWSFALSFLLVILGLSTMTVSGHSWISHRVPFETRGWAIGIFETSWAGSLLIGAPIVALLIELFGWRAPFIFVTVVSAGLAWVMSGVEGREATDDQAVRGDKRARLGAKAWSSVVMSAGIAGAGLSTIVMVGTWLEQVFGISTGGVGLIAVTFGVAELAGSLGSARLADRFGKHRTAAHAIRAVIVGLVVMMLAGTSLAIAVIGLGLFFLGFEYAVVTSFTIVSESVPQFRGRVLALNSAIGTLARGSGTIASGFLYASFGIRGTVTLSIASATVAIIALTISTRMLSGNPTSVT